VYGQKLRQRSPVGYESSRFYKREQCSTERVRSVSLLPSFFELGDARQTIRLSQHVLALADTSGLAPGRPPRSTSSKCCFCALAARHSRDHYRESGDICLHLWLRSELEDEGRKTMLSASRASCRNPGRSDAHNFFPSHYCMYTIQAYRASSHGRMLSSRRWDLQYYDTE